MLKFKKPEIKQQRLKLLVYGEMGSGKSTICCAMPNVAYFDTEDTTSKSKYSKAIVDNNGAVINTGDIDEIISQVKELMTQKHDYKTVVIDSLTVAYENLITECEKRVGSDYGRHVAAADSKIKQLVNLLLRIDANVIVTCQAKREYNSNSKNLELVGTTYAGYKRLGYMFDLVLETSVLGKNFYAMVKKSRLDTFETGEEINFNYKEIVKRCGIESLEKALNPENLATSEQVAEIKRLVQLLSVPPDLIEKWFVKQSCDCFEDMQREPVEKYISQLRSRIDSKEDKK